MNHNANKFIAFNTWTGDRRRTDSSSSIHWAELLYYVFVTHHCFSLRYFELWVFHVYLSDLLSGSSSLSSSSSSSLTLTSSQRPSGLPQGTTSPTVVGVPSAPVDLLAAHVSVRFITLSWRPPAHSGLSDIIGYTVYWKDATSDRLFLTHFSHYFVASWLYRERLIKAQLTIIVSAKAVKLCFTLGVTVTNQLKPFKISVRK